MSIEQPFLVRGHHAARLHHMLALGASIDYVLDYAQNNTVGVPKNYNNDVFGPTDETASQTNNQLRNFFEAFINLEDETPVRFISNQKDDICNSCFIGNHCDDKNRGDFPYIRAVGAIARLQGIDRVLVETQDNVDGFKFPRPAAELPAWAAKQVLSDREYHARVFPYFLRKIARRASANEAAKQQ